MDYKKHHDNLINKALKRIKPEVYYESHHIVLKKLGGDDSKSNLVNLTAREHYVIHRLIYLINPCKETKRAMISIMGAGNSRDFENKRIESANRIKGDKNPSKRLDVRKKISEKVRGSKNGMFGMVGKLNPSYGMVHDPKFLRRKQLKHSNIVISKDYNANKVIRFQCVSDCAEHYKCTSKNILFRIKQNKVGKFGKFKNISLEY